MSYLVRKRYNKKKEIKQLKNNKIKKKIIASKTIVAMTSFANEGETHKDST